MAVGRLSMGVWSSLKSPVWTIVPTGVWMPKPTPSGMLWLTSRNSMVNGPRVRGFALLTSFSDTFPCSPCSPSLAFTRPRVRRVP